MELEIALQPMEQAFWDRVELIPFHTCWEWVGHKDTDGYGILKKNGQRVKAHRFSVSLKEPLKTGLVVDHTCRNRGCVNPRHLRQVSPRENILENSRNQTAINKTKTHCKRGHEFTPENTYRYPYARVCKACVRLCKNSS